MAIEAFAATGGGSGGVFSHGPNFPQELAFRHSHVRILNVTLPTRTDSVDYRAYGTTGSQLSISIKPNQLSWAYGLNTQSYPTYAGEVVQVLSAYVDNMTISGDLRTYRDMELIYKWFIAYMTVSTQGVTGAPLLTTEFRYNQEPVQMEYAHRGWTLLIRPLSLPTMTYGTDVVVPNWQMEAAVVEDENMRLTTMMNSDIPAIVQSGLTKLDANFGLGVENPFNYWDGNYQQADLNKFLKGNEPILNSNSNNTQLQDWFSSLVTQYAKGNVDLDASSPFSTPYTQYKDASSSITLSAGGLTSSSTTGIFTSSLSPTVPDGITKAGTVEGVIQAAQIAAANQKNYQYDELTGPARDPTGGLFSTTVKPIVIDCSSFVTLCFQAAGCPDPNGLNYSYIGNTTTLMSNATLQLTGLVEPGFLHFWANPDHVALAIDGNGGIIEMVPNGPITLTVAEETPYHHNDYLGCYKPNIPNFYPNT